MVQGFKNLIELDEARMIKDGIDPVKTKQNIDDIAQNTIGFISKESNTYLFNSSGARDWMLYKLKKDPIFMKYVKKWINDDPLTLDDLLLQYNKMGIRCNYE